SIILHPPAESRPPSPGDLRDNRPGGFRWPPCYETGMGRRWSLALVGAILLGAIAFAPIVHADPAISRAAADEGLAEWRFSNPANYTASNVDLGPAGASPARLSLSPRDSTRSDFS